MRVGYSRVIANEVSNDYLLLLKANSKSSFAAMESRINRIKSKMDLLNSYISDIRFYTKKTNYKLEIFDPSSMLNNLISNKKSISEKYKEITEENILNEEKHKEISDEIQEMIKEERKLLGNISKERGFADSKRNKIQRIKAECLQLMFEIEVESKNKNRNSVQVDELSYKYEEAKAKSKSVNSKLENQLNINNELRNEIRNSTFVLSAKRTALYHFVNDPLQNQDETMETINKYKEDCSNLNQLIEKYSENIGNLEKEMNSIRKEKHLFLAENLKIEELIGFNKEKISQFKDSIKHSEEKIKELDIRKSQCDEKMLHCRQEEVDVNYDKSKADNHNDKLKEDIKELDDEISSLEKEIEELENKVQKANQSRKKASTVRKPTKRTFLKVNW